MRVLIIGGGIGGLAAACAMRKVGIEHLVLERAPTPTEVGAGISMWPNAMRALDWLGVGGAVRSRGMVMNDAAIKSSSGRTLTRAEMREICGKLGAEFVMIHRAGLLDALLTGTDERWVRWRKSLSSVEDGCEGVIAHFEDGTSEQGDVLVGADGLRSTVRPFVCGDEPPRYSGQTAYRGLVEFSHPSFADGTVWEVWGVGARFGITCLPRGVKYWWATHSAPPRPVGAAAADPKHKEALQKVFRGWCDPIEAMIGATDADDIVRHDLFDRTPRRGWSRGRITMLGDAAHPMTPNLGQGGCSAIEDGVVLARCLRSAHGRDKDSIEAALIRYERLRFARTANLVRQSRFLGWWGQRPSRWQCRVRDAIFSVISGYTFEPSMMRFGAYDAAAVE